jgi:hypothetical protein
MDCKETRIVHLERVLREMYSNCVILHLEDSDDDSLFAQTALKRVGFTGAYRRVSSTTDALMYLKGEGEFADRRMFPAPNVLLCDSSVAGEHTLGAVLDWVFGVAIYRRLAVVFLTGGIAPGDIAGWLSRGVREVLDKGNSLEDLARRMRDILRHCPPEQVS